MRRTAATAAAIGILVAACAGSGDPEPTLSGTAPPAEVIVSLSEWRFSPAAIGATAETEVVLEVRNVGTIDHEWALLDEPIAGESGFDAGHVLARIRVSPGAVGRIEVTVPAAGEYQVICPIPGHFSQGMVGSLSASG